MLLFEVLAAELLNAALFGDPPNEVLVPDIDALEEPTLAAFGEGWCGTFGDIPNPAVAFVTVPGDPREVTLRRVATFGDDAVAEVPEVATAAGTLGELGGVICVGSGAKLNFESGEADGAFVLGDALNEPG
jgi:hypothetical protein